MDRALGEIDAAKGVLRKAETALLDIQGAIARACVSQSGKKVLHVKVQLCKGASDDRTGVRLPSTLLDMPNEAGYRAEVTQAMMSLLWTGKGPCCTP